MPIQKRRIEQSEVVKQFADRLRQVRVSRGMTQAELSKQTGIAVSYIWKLESAGAAPGIDLVERLAKALGTTLHDLLPLGSRPDTVAVLRSRSESLFEALVAGADQDVLAMLVPLLAKLNTATKR